MHARCRLTCVFSLTASLASADIGTLSCELIEIRDFGCSDAAQIELQFNCGTDVLPVVQDPNDPPARALIDVMTCDETFRAEPVWIADGAIVGFSKTNGSYVILMTVIMNSTNRTARYVVEDGEMLQTFEGQCRDRS